MRPFLLATALGLSFIGPAVAQHTTPQVATSPDPVTVTLEGRTFVNHGLVAVGRLPPDLRDSMGDTLGSFSGMAVDEKAWRREGTGYVGRITTLPDRGYNDPTTSTFADYATRLQRFDIRFDQAGTFTLAYAGTQPLTDADGGPTTGYDPGSGTAERFGMAVPMPPVGGKGGGRVTIDAEAIAVRPDGDFYVSDEYRPGIYLFSPEGRLKGIVPVPQALVPESPPGTVDFNSLKPPAHGRRNNQGLEGMSITPDGRRLMVLLQSAAVQDSTMEQQTRNNTRLLVYDIADDALPPAPIGHYVVTLPTFRNKGDGAAPDRTAAASEVLALDDKTILLLPRDGTGLGSGSANPIVYKNVQLASIAHATNLSGTPFETSYKPVATGGVLDTAIRPAESLDFVNLLNTPQLARFGMNLKTGDAVDRMTLGEKWESLGLLSALDPARPDDWFLLVGNDNDFATRNGTMQGNAYDAGVDSDNLILVYRLTLPR